MRPCRGDLDRFSRSRDILANRTEYIQVIRSERFRLEENKIRRLQDKETIKKPKVEFNVGDNVLVKIPSMRQHLHKTNSPWFGPYIKPVECTTFWSASRSRSSKELA